MVGQLRSFRCFDLFFRGSIRCSSWGFATFHRLELRCDSHPDPSLPWHEVCFVAGNEFAHQHKGGLGLARTPQKITNSFRSLESAGTPPIMIFVEHGYNVYQHNIYIYIHVESHQESAYIYSDQVTNKSSQQHHTSIWSTWNTSPTWISLK